MALCELICVENQIRSHRKRRRLKWKAELLSLCSAHPAPPEWLTGNQQPTKNNQQPAAGGGQLATGHRPLAAGKVKCKEQSKAKWVTQVKVNCGALEKPWHFPPRLPRPGALSTFLFGCTIAARKPGLCFRSVLIGSLGPNLRSFTRGALVTEPVGQN